MPKASVMVTTNLVVFRNGKTPLSPALVFRSITTVAPVMGASPLTISDRYVAECERGYGADVQLGIAGGNACCSRKGVFQLDVAALSLASSGLNTQRANRVILLGPKFRKSASQLMP